MIINGFYETEKYIKRLSRTGMELKVYDEY